MSLLYLSGFRVGGTNTMTATVAGSAATIAETTYIAGDLAITTLWPAGGYGAFSVAVKSAFDTATGSTFTVTISAAGLYTISRGANFTLAFSTAADLRLRAALGFTGDKSGTNTYTSDEVPRYVLAAAVSARSNVSNIYEPDGIVEESVSDGGVAYGTALRTDEKLSDWTQAMESKVQTFTRGNQTNAQWTWQEFFAHQRMTHPFVVRGPADGDTTDPTYQLRADGASFRPGRVTSDDDTYWNIGFKCRDLGEANP